MAESEVKKLQKALQEVATYAATGREHYRMIYDDAKKLADTLRNAKDGDPGVARAVSAAFKEMDGTRAFLPRIMSGFDKEYRIAETAKAAFEKAASKAK